MTQWNDYGLREHPFPLLPGASVRNWAGMADVRRSLEDIATSVLKTDSGLSEFVVIHGSYGAGKTHALKYMTTMINEMETERYNSRAVYVPKIKLGPKISFLEVYRQIMQTLGKEFIEEVAGRVNRCLEQEIQSRQPADPERGFAEIREGILNELGSDVRGMVRLLIDVDGGDQGGVRFLIEGNPGAKESGYPQAINNDFLAVQVLADLFNAMTRKIGGSGPIFNGVHLFIDEVEDILEAKNSEQVDFYASVRELVNRLPENFALLLAYSADAALLEAMMPLGLAERTTRPNIELQALEIEDARNFVAKQLGDFRPSGFEPPQAFYPFSEESVNLVLEQTVILVPRRIFRNLRQVLDRVIRREGLQPGEEVSAEVTADVLAQIGIT